ncbi:MAG: hypothetical protein BWY00_01775 [Firmicutes bacterium ADurb.Bin153]|nr:MAG: hypothetical protein BWY00_01775 [Firmicutes bacterium ADurb.Bin153]
MRLAFAYQVSMKVWSGLTTLISLPKASYCLLVLLPRASVTSVSIPRESYFTWEASFQMPPSRYSEAIRRPLPS